MKSSKMYQSGDQRLSVCIKTLTDSTEIGATLIDNTMNVLPTCVVDFSIEEQDPHNEELLNFCILFTQKLSAFGRVKELEEKEFYETSDFEGVAQSATLSMKCMTIFLEKLRNHGSDLVTPLKVMFDKFISRMLSNVLPSILILTCEHYTDFAWTSSESRKCAIHLRSLLLALCKCESVELLFKTKNSGNGDVFAKLMKELQPRLGKSSWKRNRSLIEVFKYYLHNVKLPELSNYIEVVLPPSLNIVDDHEVENKILGVSCLQHIIDNTSASELKWYGRAEVIYEALQHQLYTREAPLLSLSLPCLLSCLKVLEGSCATFDSGFKENRYDEILQRILTDMEMENLIKNRHIYSREIISYIQSMGITITRHLPRLLRVTTNYLEVSDTPTELARLNALEMLRTILLIAWCRISNHSETIFRTLIVLIYDVSTDVTTTDKRTKDILIEKATENLVLLKHVQPLNVIPWLEALKDTNTNNTCRSVFCTILADNPK